MKRIRKFIYLMIVLALPLLIFAGCEDMSKQSIKSITSPYIATYECTEASFGGDDLLERFEFIHITLLDKEELELAYKPRGKGKVSKTFPYTFDDETKELSASGTVLGSEIMEKVKIEDGKFAIKKTLGNKTLIMKFKVK